PLLPLTAAESLQHQRQAVLHIPRCLAQTGAEIAQPSRLHPRIVLRPAGQPLAMNVGGEQLGEGGTDALIPCRLPNEVAISIDRKAHSGQQVAQDDDFLTRQAAGLAQANPGYNPALAVLPAVVVKNAL